MQSSASQRKSKPNPQQTMLIVAVIIGVAVIGAGVLIMLTSSAAAVNPTSYEGIPTSRQPDGGFVIGNPEARVTVIEWADYACPACISYLSDTERFIEQYVKTGKARFEFRVLPTAGGQLTAFLGQIAQCLDEQRPGAYWDAKDRLFQMASTGRYNQDSGRVLAQDLGLDYNQALTCARTARQVQIDTELANREGITGTPAVKIRIDDGPLAWVESNGQPWNRGGVPFAVLAGIVDANS